MIVEFTVCFEGTARSLPLVYVHGYGGSGICWQMTPDISDHAQDIPALGALSKCIGNHILVTHSAGGVTGWLSAMQNVEVKAVVAYEPGGFVFPESEVPERVDQYIGPLAKDVMRIRLEHLAYIPGEKERRMADLKVVERFKTYKPARCIRIGEDIRITPYFVSHSAADAYMFLIEADGKRILHTGDFRQHGYLGKGLLPTLEKNIAPQGIDVLITEGTMLDRAEKKIVHENDLKRQAIELMKRCKNVFVLCSSTDMDRLATFHQANRAMCNRPFVCDAYQQQILNLFTDHAGKKSPLFKFDYKVYGSDERNEKLRKWMLDKGFTMILRSNSRYRQWADSLLPELNPDETLLIYSMFRGYILPTHEAYNPDLKAFIDRFPHFEYVHTSGHATTDTLAAVCRAVPPHTAIIPIHRAKDSDFASLDIGDELRSKIVTASQTIDGIDILVK